jgi:hypothetical protein
MSYHVESKLILFTEIDKLYSLFSKILIKPLISIIFQYHWKSKVQRAYNPKTKSIPFEYIDEYERIEKYFNIVLTGLPHEEQNFYQENNQIRFKFYYPYVIKEIRKIRKGENFWYKNLDEVKIDIFSFRHPVINPLGSEINAKIFLTDNIAFSTFHDPIFCSIWICNTFQFKLGELFQEWSVDGLLKLLQHYIPQKFLQNKNFISKIIFTLKNHKFQSETQKEFIFGFEKLCQNVEK